jgi:pilus assembly protein CpaE
VNLAAAIAGEHGRCGLLDLNLRGGDLATLLGLKARHSLTDLCGRPQLDQAMFEQSLTLHPTGIRLLASPTMLENVGNFDVAIVEQIVDMAALSFPFVVADLEDVFHREQFRVVANCDVLLLALRLDFVSLVRTGRTLMYLQREGVEMAKVKLVANRHCAAIDVPLRKAQEALGRPIAQAIPDNPKVMVAANNMGSPAVCDAPTSNVAKALRELAQAVMVG